MAMTREQAMLKLLAIEPERRDRIRRITGWPPGESDRVLRRLERAGRIRSVQSICQCADYRVYFVDTYR